jgi:hypothetical protein
MMSTTSHCVLKRFTRAGGPIHYSLPMYSMTSTQRVFVFVSGVSLLAIVLGLVASAMPN